MSWYQAILNVNGMQGDNGTHGLFVFFDTRLLSELHAALWREGYIEVERVSTQTGLESRGSAILRDPHVVAIEKRLDLDIRAPDGPPRPKSGLQDEGERKESVS